MEAATDWYSVDFKRRNQEVLQSEYWRFWTIQARCYRKTIRLEQADQLLRTMEERAALRRNHSAPTYW
jgi:hypothetical protein